MFQWWQPLQTVKDEKEPGIGLEDISKDRRLRRILEVSRMDDISIGRPMRRILGRGVQDQGYFRG